MKFKTLDSPVEAKREIRAGDVLRPSGAFTRFVVVATDDDLKDGVETIKIYSSGEVSGVEILSWTIAQQLNLIGRVLDFENLTLEIEPV